MESYPKVTVLMPSYNAEKYLGEAVESILNQTFEDFEFIIINDGSTDKSADIIESYSDKRIKAIHNQKNIGLIKTLNKGIYLSKGKYIARQDADDISLPDRLKKQVQFLDERPEIAMVGSAAIRINRDGKVLDVIKYPADNKSIKNSLLRQNTFWHTSVMLRKECLNEVGSYREFFKYIEDYDLWLRISERYKVANFSEPLVKYRFQLNSVTVKNLKEQLIMQDITKKIALERKKKGTDRFLIKSYKDQNDLFSTANNSHYQAEVENILVGWIRKFTKIGETKGAQSLALALIKNNPKKIKNYKVYLNCLRRHIKTTLFYLTLRKMTQD
jgi:glycosyltransferase involved in cell wall biosynthesis